MGIGYIREEIGDFTPSKYEPKSYTWIINIVGYIGYALSLLFVLYGGVILLIADLRNKFLGFGIGSLMSASLVFILASYVIANYGVKYFYISENAFVFKTPFKSPQLINKDEMIHIGVKRPNPALSLLPLTSPTLVIATYDKLYKIKTSRWNNEDEILNRFDDFSRILTDEFAEYYHKSKTTLNSFLIRMSQDTAGITGLTIIVIYIFLATWGAMALIIEGGNPYTPYVLFLRNPDFANGELPEYDWDTARFHPPSNDFWFGTDFLGRDIFARLIYGTTFTFLIALSGALVSIILVIFLGITSGYFTGHYDTIVSRVSDALLTFPPFIPLILISTIATPIRLNVPGGYFFAVFIGMSLFTWPMGTRIIRTEVIDLLANDYILAAKQIGATNFFLLKHHILPKIIPTVLILFAYSFADIILGTTLLGFIGMDSESTLTWGSDLAKAVQYGEDLRLRWWTVVFPTAWIFFLVFGLHLFSDSIRDVLDPKLRGGEKAIPLEFQRELDEIRKSKEASSMTQRRI